MAAYCTARVLIQKCQLKQVIVGSTRSLSLASVFREKYASLQCVFSNTLQPTAMHTTGCRRSRLSKYINGREKHENYKNTSSRQLTSAMWGALAFSFFSAEEDDPKAEAQKKKDEILLLLKKAKLSMYRGQLEAASGFLHEAIGLAHRTHNTKAIIYTYSLMANLAYVQGQLDNSEKLFKAAMSYMLSGGTPQDDNGVIEISLKLATIYAGQGKDEMSELGFRFCTDSLEAKLEKMKESPAEEQSEELRKETRLLLGLCLDSHARYMASTQRLKQATKDYRNALQICREEQGESHPQTLVLMSDLATILDLQGLHDEALPIVQKAVEISQNAGHPDHHVLLGNMAGILLHQGQFDESVRVYKEALSLAQSLGDAETMEQILEGLKEVDNRRKEKENSDG